MSIKNQETGNPAKIRWLNRNAILSYVRDAQTTTRSQLRQALQLAPSTVTTVVAGLLEDKLLLESDGEEVSSKRARGRPLKFLSLNPNAAFTLGISLRLIHNTLYVDASLSNYCSQVKFSESLKCNSPSSLEEVLGLITQSIKKVKLLLPPKSKIIGLGVGIPGVVSGDNVLFSPNLPFIEGEKLHRYICDFIKVSVFFENDASLLVASELQKQQSLRTKNVSYLFISQGLGSATAMSGELWKASSWSGEIGHIDVPFEDGTLRRLEWILGLDGYFAEKMAEIGIAFDSAKPISETLLNSSEARQILESYTSYLFLAVQVLNSSFGLDLLIIGTSNGAVLNHCIPGLEELIASSPLKVDVIYSPKAQNAVVEGAALLALTSAMGDLHRGLFT